MTEVAFHFNAPDKWRYACRFARKALRHGASVIILAPPEGVARLDALLWSFSPTDFVAHCRLDADDDILSRTPVVLWDAGLPERLPHCDVLLNLTDAIPSGFQRFANLVEVVQADSEPDRASARTRWRAYAGQGLPVKGHDLVLKDAA